MINRDDTSIGQTALLASSSDHDDEPIGRQSKDSMLTVFAIVFAFGIRFFVVN